MQQQFTKIFKLVLAIVAVATIASLATAVVMLSSSQDGADGDGSAGSSPGQFGVEQAGESLGAEVGDAVAFSDRGELKERANLILDARGDRGRIKGQVFLDVFVNDQGKVTVQTRAEVGGLPNGEYGLWLEPPADFQEAGMQSRLLQIGKYQDVLDLGRDATQFPLSVTELPVTVTTLEGFTLTFRQVQVGIGPASAEDPVLLSRPIDRLVRY